MYIYIYVCILSVFNKNNKYLTLHCVSWINSNRKMATIYLVFLKAKIHQSKNKIISKVTRHVQSVIKVLLKQEI